jgi:MftR C-terminal domain
LTGLAGLAIDFAARSDTIRHRASVVAAHPELQAREMARTAPWTARLREALLRRGSPAAEVNVAASLALVVFRLAYDLWIAEPKQRALDARLGDVLAEIQAQTDRGRREFTYLATEPTPTRSGHPGA